MKFTLELRMPIAWDTWLKQTIWKNTIFRTSPNNPDLLRVSPEVVTHPKWRNKVEGGEDLLYVLEIISYIFCQIQHFKEIARLFSIHKLWQKRIESDGYHHVRAPLLFDMNDSVRSLTFNCSATSWQMILSLLYENSQISVIILNNGFCVRIWVSFCHNLSNFLSEHQVVSSFNSTIVINCMIFTDSLSFCHIHHHQFAQESYWQILNLELNVFKRKVPGSVTADESDDNAEQDQEQVQLSTPTPLWTKSATN